jgi:hypothetical protein
MASVGINDMVIDKVELYSSKEKMPPPEVIERRKEAGAPKPVEDNKPETQAYVLRLLRKVNGVKVESTHGSSMTSINGASYGKEWMYEALTIAVDDKGSANLYWTGPLSVTNVMTENTTIRPWSDIESVFKKMIIIDNTGYAEHSPSVRIDVTHVSLSLQRIMERDSFTSGLLVPVWNFYGTRTLTDEQGNPVVTDETYFPLLSINAIDGSTIDPLQGY